MPTSNDIQDDGAATPGAPEKRLFLLLMIGAAVLLLGACLAVTRYRGDWVIVLLIAAAFVYIACRLGSVGMWKTWSGALGILLLFAGFLGVSKLSPGPVVKGIGIACFSASGVCFFLFARGRSRAKLDALRAAHRSEQAKSPQGDGPSDGAPGPKSA